jgi:hypothetical protein
MSAMAEPVAVSHVLTAFQYTNRDGELQSLLVIAH